MEETVDIINRPLYLKRIRPYINKDLVKVLTGQRRVGKSFVLKSIINEIKENNPSANIIYFNLEKFTFSHITTASILNDEIESRLQKNAKNYIFIDEIQEVDNFEKVIRSLLLNPNNDVYITGSNSKMLSSEISTVLAGRKVEFEIHPLNYHEFLMFHNLELSDESLNLYIRYGGMPYLKYLFPRDTWNEYLTGLTDSIIYRDIVNRHKVRNTDFLERLVLFFSDNIGNIFTAKRISDFLKSQKANYSVTTIQAYAGYLEQAFLTHKVRRWDIEGKRFFEIGEKIFFEDIGIRNAIIGYRPQDINGIMENLVYNHFKVFGYDVKIGVMYRDKEIDFIAEKDGETMYVQVCVTIDQEETFEREFGNLIQIPDNFKKLVVTFRDSSPNTHKGIQMITLRDFLSQPLD